MSRITMSIKGKDSPSPARLTLYRESRVPVSGTRSLDKTLLSFSRTPFHQRIIRATVRYIGVVRHAVREAVRVQWRRSFLSEEAVVSGGAWHTGRTRQ